MFDGKAFGLEIVEAVRGHVDRTVAPLLRRIDALEKQLREMPVARDGKDADPAEIATLVEEAVAKLPVPRDGKDADPTVVAKMVAEAVQEASANVVVRAEQPALTSEMVKAIVQEELGKLPPPKDGKDADPAAIRDMVAAEVSAAVAALPRPKDGKSVSAADVAPMVAEEVGKAVAALPKPRDPVGVAGAVIDRAGSLVLTLSDGSHKDLGPVVGKDVDEDVVAALVMSAVAKIPTPKDGRDGFGFDDMSLAHDGERSFTLRFARGDQVKEFAFDVPVVIDRGVWREGQYAKGDAVTWGGSLWIAREATAEKPETSAAWRLAVKRGRDGKDAPSLPKAAPSPIRAGVPGVRP